MLILPAGKGSSKLENTEISKYFIGKYFGSWFLPQSLQWSCPVAGLLASVESFSLAGIDGRAGFFEPTFPCTGFMSRRNVRRGPALSWRAGYRMTQATTGGERKAHRLTMGKAAAAVKEKERIGAWEEEET